MTSFVFMRSVVAGDHVLVKVYADGRQAGILAFTDEQWSEIEEDGGTEIVLAEKYEGSR